MARTAKVLKPKVIGYIRKMIAAVLAEPKMYDQELFPSPNNGAVCDTPFCAAGHLIEAKSPRLFARLCKQKYKGEAVGWENEAMKILGLEMDMYVWFKLFGSYVTWPDKYRKMYGSSHNKKTALVKAMVRAKAFAAFWEEVIATDASIALNDN